MAPAPKSPKTLIVDRELLVVSPHNARKDADLDNERGRRFVANIDRRGVRKPLLVHKLGKKGKRDTWGVIQGQRRLLAAEQLKIDDLVVEEAIDANGKPITDPLELRRLSMEEQDQTEPMTPNDYAENARIFMESGRFETLKDVAEYMDMSPPRLSAMLAQATLPDEVKEAIASGKLKKKPAEEIAQGFDTEAEQKKAAKVVASVAETSDDQVEAARVLKKNKDLLKKPQKEANEGLQRALKKLEDQKRAELAPKLTKKQRDEVKSLLKDAEREDLIKQVDALDSKDHAGLHSLKDIALQAIEERKKAEAPEPTRAPNPEAVAAAADIGKRQAVVDQGTTDLVSHHLKTITVVAKLSTGVEVPIDGGEFLGLRNQVISAIAVEVTKQGIELPPIRARRRATDEDLGSAESHGVREEGERRAKS